MEGIKYAKTGDSTIRFNDAAAAHAFVIAEPSFGLHVYIDAETGRIYFAARKASVPREGRPRQYGAVPADVEHATEPRTRTERKAQRVMVEHAEVEARKARNIAYARCGMLGFAD